MLLIAICAAECPSCISFLMWMLVFWQCHVCNSNLGNLKAGDSMWIYKSMVHCENCFEVTRGKRKNNIYMCAVYVQFLMVLNIKLKWINVCLYIAKNNIGIILFPSTDKWRRWAIIRIKWIIVLCVLWVTWVPMYLDYDKLKDLYLGVLINDSYFILIASNIQCS